MSAQVKSVETDELEDLFDSLAHAHRAPPVQIGVPAVAIAQTVNDSAPGAASRVLKSVGQLTRQLHDTLAELGYDGSPHEYAGAALPDARQRLAYVATLTEQAATRSLSAVELVIPLQEGLAAEAQGLGARWDVLFNGAASVAEMKLLAHATRDYLHTVPARTAATRTHLREIVMAQEFQDLTGQALKRVTDLASHLETQLLKLLVENSPAPLRRPDALGLLNGPAIAADSEIVANQAQVDDLLESLGF